MAWTTPRTWSTGEVVTAALMNTHVRDNLSYLKGEVDTLQAMDFPETLSNQVTPAGVPNVGTAETTLFSYTVPANTWDVNDRVVRAFVSGICAATANNKVFRFYLGGTGGTKLWDSGNTTINDEWWTVEVQISRVGVGSQYYTVSVIFGRGAPAASVQAEDRGSSSEDETTTLDLVFTGQSSVGGGEITAYQMLVEKAA